MCDIRPGTRCAYDMRSKVNKRTEKLAEAKEKYGNSSPEALLAQEKLKLAERQYDATKEGIKNIEKLITKTDYDEELIKRYKDAKNTNSVQTLSVKEIKTGRQETVAEITAALYGTNKEETFSILEAARTFQENNLIASQNEDSLLPVSKDRWREYNETLKATLTEEGKLTAPLNKKIDELSNTNPPSEYIFSCYSSYGRLMSLAHKQKQEQHRMIAALIGSDEKTVSEAHMKLRESYATLNPKPTVPEQWIRGESANSGIMNSRRFRYAPSDPASAYATYTLMYNSDALPDYQKRSQNFVLIEQHDSKVSLHKHSSSGKLLYTEEYDKSNPNLIAKIRQGTEGATLITERPNRTGVSLEEIALQHLDIPSYSKTNVRAALKSDTDSVVELFLKTMNSSKKVWNSKKERKELK